MSYKALEHYLEPVTPFLELDGVTEVCINQPGEVYVERYGQFECSQLKELTYEYLYSLAILVAEFNHKKFPTPLLSGSLLKGERIQFVLNPACESKKIVCSIRKHRMKEMTLDDYEVKDSFKQITDKDSNQADEQYLSGLFQQKQIKAFLKAAIQLKKNILISGGTGTGKTTFLNACLKCIPEYERIITVEDTREVKVTQSNKVHLLFNEEEDSINATNIFKTCLRLRPDRILLSELRGKEVWSYLRAANSGHPGSLSTIHADNPEGAFRQLVLMMQQANSSSSEEQLMQYIKSIIHIVVQLKRHKDPKRHTLISDVYFNGKNVLDEPSRTFSK